LTDALHTVKGSRYKAIYHDLLCIHIYHSVLEKRSHDEQDGDLIKWLGFKTLKTLKNAISHFPFPISHFNKVQKCIDLLSAMEDLTEDEHVELKVFQLLAEGDLVSIPANPASCIGYDKAVTNLTLGMSLTSLDRKQHP
jgi:hypothetical protein